MKNTEITTNYTNDDTLLCRRLPKLLAEQLAAHALRAASVELCDSIVREVEFTALCKLHLKAVDMTDHAVLIS